MRLEAINCRCRLLAHCVEEHWKVGCTGLKAYCRDSSHFVFIGVLCQTGALRGNALVGADAVAVRMTSTCSDSKLRQNAEAKTKAACRYF